MPPYNTGTSVTKNCPILTPVATESVAAQSNNTRVSDSIIQQVITSTLESPVAEPCNLPHQQPIFHLFAKNATVPISTFV